MHGRRQLAGRQVRSLMKHFPAMRLTATNLACTRGEQTVFSGLNFSVAGGQAMAVTGMNGAGKTTLLRLLAGLLRPAEGAVAFSGGGGDGDATLAEQAHYLGHQDALKSALSVDENLNFWARYLVGTADSPMKTENLAPRLSESLSLWGLLLLRSLPAAYLSAGQRRRLSLCRLTVIRRPVWLLDEPTAALDATAQATLGTVMAAHLADGGIIIAATHGPLPIPAAIEFPLRAEHRGGRAA